MVEYDRRPVLKKSIGKATDPGRRQILRYRDGQDRYARDLLILREEPVPPDSEALLVEVMAKGKRTSAPVPLEESRKRLEEELSRLDPHILDLGFPAPYPVERSEKLLHLREHL